MYIFLILFILSLAAVVFMVSQKLALVKSGKYAEQSHIHPFVPSLNKVKQTSIEKAKQIEHMALVTILRTYVRSLNLTKNQYRKLRAKMVEIKNGHKNGNGEVEAGEVSRFLKMISDYKHKIRTIKEKIHEEEKK